MKIFDIFKKTKKDDKVITLRQIKQENYEQRYFEECRYIWKNYVPKSGQSEVLQGELLRELEKLRYEAQNNGNINWDEDFSYFCDFIMRTLCGQTIYSDEEKIKIKLILSYLKECGNYAKRVCDGQIPDDQVNIERIAYIEDDLYNIIADAIGQLQAQHPEPILFEKNTDIKR